MQINGREMVVAVAGNSPDRFCCCTRFSPKVYHVALYAKSIAYPMIFLVVVATPESDNMNSTVRKI